MTSSRVAIAIIHEAGRFFLQRRGLAAAWGPGLWEFPGGKAEAGETAAQALLRELREEVAWRPKRMEPLPLIQYAYPALEVELNPFLCEGVSALPTSLAWGWFTLREWECLRVPEANRQLRGTLAGLVLQG